MQELDRWTDANMIAPLLQIAPDYREGHAVAWKKTVETVMKAIRTKMLESYQRNGRRRRQAGQEAVAAMTSRKLLELAYTGLIGFEVGSILDLAQARVAVGTASEGSSSGKLSRARR